MECSIRPNRHPWLSNKKFSRSERLRWGAGVSSDRCKACFFVSHWPGTSNYAECLELAGFMDERAGILHSGKIHILLGCLPGPLVIRVIHRQLASCFSRHGAARCQGTRPAAGGARNFAEDCGARSGRDVPKGVVCGPGDAWLSEETCMTPRGVRSPCQ